MSVLRQLAAAMHSLLAAKAPKNPAKKTTKKPWRDRRYSDEEILTEGRERGGKV
jgi:hypothetical protein